MRDIIEMHHIDENPDITQKIIPDLVGYFSNILGHKNQIFKLIIDSGKLHELLVFMMAMKYFYK